MPAQAGLHTVTSAGPGGGGSRRTGLARYCLAAAGIDGAFYLTLTGVPFKAIQLGAAPLVLGLLPAVWSIVYISGCGVAGRLSDRMSRIRMARVGTLIVAAAIGVMALTPVLAGLFAGLALAASGLSLFWPALQAAIADRGERSRLDQELGWFNISWCGGKSLGFLVGGVLLAAFGFGALFGLSLLVVLGVTLLLGGLPGSGMGLAGRIQVPIGATPDGVGGSMAAAAAGPLSDEVTAVHRSPQAVTVTSSTPSAADEAPVPAQRRAAFLLMAWVANGASYGAAATLNYHYPRFLHELGLGSKLFGGFLGLVYLSQTVTFFVLMRTVRWHYRRLPLYVSQLGLVLLLFLLPSLNVPGLVLLLSPLAGVEQGLAYFSSIYYSLHIAERPGRNTGYHEAVIGSGTLLVPPLGGFLATRLGSFSVPFLFCGMVVLLAIVIEEVVARNAFRSTGPRFPASASIG